MTSDMRSAWSHQLLPGNIISSSEKTSCFFLLVLVTPGSVLVFKLLPISLSLAFSQARALSLSLLRTGGGHLRTLSTGRECERSRFHVWDSGEHPKEWEYFERGAHRSRHERSPNMDARRRGAGCEHGRAEVRDPRGCDCDHLPRSVDRSCCWRLFWGNSSRIVED